MQQSRPNSPYKSRDYTIKTTSMSAHQAWRSTGARLTAGSLAYARGAAAASDPYV